MISVVITTFREINTICKAIEAILPQLSLKDELLIVSPDDNMGEIINRYSKRYKHIYWIRDKGNGKPSALNLGFKKARGDVLILTDGDVFMSKKALFFLIKPFVNAQVGAVSGHPVSRDKRNSMFGFWSQLLTNAAHQTRLTKIRENMFLECSGYLYAVRKRIVKKVPEDALAEDAVISHIIAGKNFKIEYAPNAHVYVKYPKNYKDWLRQKIRSTGGYTQKYITKSPYKMRTFLYELLSGPKIVLQYPKNFKEIIWTITLFLARIHLWILVTIKLRLLKKSLPSLWLRVESTK